MMAKRQTPARRTHEPQTYGARSYVLGVDGGGTKTQAVILDAHGRVAGEGLAGPSNPLRVGLSNAGGAVRTAFDRALAAAGLRRADVAAAHVGLAGVRRADLRERMRENLISLGVGTLEVSTDAEIALYGATDGAPGLVIIAGTGSICCGVNARGRRACAGGWGPVAGDEGGGSWIARRGLQAVARAADGRGEPTALVGPCLEYFKVNAVEDLSTAIYAPNMTNERIAGFARHVIEAAVEGDDIAGRVVEDAGRELGEAAAAVVVKLRMGRDRFQAAHVGGMFTAGELLLGPLRETLVRVAPRAYLSPPQHTPAVAAARMARGQLPRLALAG